MKILLHVGAIALTIAATPNGLDACGDKFLVPARGSGFERAPATGTPAEVLLYAPPESGLPAVLGELSLAPALRRAGYRPVMVVTREEFDQALTLKRWDLVVVDLATARTLAGRLQAATDPAVVPVVSQSKNELADARRQYSSVLRTPARSRALIDVLDTALARHRRIQAGR